MYVCMLRTRRRRRKMRRRRTTLIIIRQDSPKECRQWPKQSENPYEKFNPAGCNSVPSGCQVFSSICQSSTEFLALAADCLLPGCST